MLKWTDDNGVMHDKVQIAMNRLKTFEPKEGGGTSWRSAVVRTPNVFTISLKWLAWNLKRITALPVLILPSL